MTTVLLVGDIRLYREGLAEFIRRDGRVLLAGTAATRTDALATAARLVPDVVLLDMAMAGALELLGDLVVEAGGAAVLALTVPETELAVLECVEGGARGYVTRESSLEELVLAIEHVARGETAISPRMTTVLVRRLSALAAAHAEQPSLVDLTPRQREVVALLGVGLSNKEIAARLCIEVATVKNHVHQILEKLNVHRRADVARALREEDLHPVA